MNSKDPRVASRRSPRLLAALIGALAVLATVAVATALAKPEYVLPPKVSGEPGEPRVGERLVCASGTWKGAPSFKYEWVREGLKSGEGPSYYLTKADEHKEVWCVVTASIGAESSVAESINSICLAGSCGGPPPVAPAVKEPGGRPEVSGTPVVGKVLSCSHGEWTGTEPITYTYKWLRDAKEPIKGAIASTYTVVAEDETHALSCRVTAENAALIPVAAESKNSLTVAGTAPKNTTAPEVLGVAAVGESLTCYEGTWTGSVPLTYEFRWFRNGAEIPMATGSTRIVETADEGQSLLCKVTAKNKEGKAEAASKAVTVTGKLKAGEPAPSISGKLEEGQTLSCSEGTWNQTKLTFKYQWLRDKTEAILGATGKEYKVASADKAHLLYCQVVARNEKGEEVSAISEPVGIPKGPGVPKETALPEVVGDLVVGHSQTCKEGTWTGSPTSYVDQWLRDHAPISGATSGTYVVKAADEGHLLSCRVIAQNSEGASEPAESAGSYIQGEAPKNLILPEVSARPGTPHVGESLSCLPGQWSGQPTPTYSYEWLREGSTAVGTNAPAYTIAAADRGHSLSCRVTAKNVESEASALSANSVAIPGAPPTPPLAGPTVSIEGGGEAEPGKTLKCEPGSWEGAPAPVFAYQWLLNGGPIVGATKASFAIVGADRGFVLSCRVSGTNSEGSESATSKGVEVSGIAPSPEELPFVSGNATVGSRLTCEAGSWSGKPPPAFSFRWLRDGGAIAGAADENYTVEPSDQGHRIACEVTATNRGGSVQEESTNVLLITARVTLTKTETTVPTGGGTKVVLPTPGAILASLNRQLATALPGATIGKLTKTGSFTFAFLSPSAGTLQVSWYVTVKGVHGAKSKQVVLAQATSSFTLAKKATVTLRLTAAGQRMLKHRKRMTLKAKATFTIAGHAPVAWTATLVLHR